MLTKREQDRIKCYFSKLLSMPNYGSSNKWYQLEAKDQGRSKAARECEQYKESCNLVVKVMMVDNNSIGSQLSKFISKNYNN